VILELHRTAI